jgi:hypothetical protein
MRPLRIALAFIAALAAFPAASMTDGRTAQDRPSVSGGITPDEVADLRTKQPFYNLSVLTAARGSGAYLASVKVRIVDAQTTPVLETVMDGPYLLVDLAPGKYQLELVNEGETQKRTLTMQEGRPQRLVVYFNSDAEVSPDAKK